MPDEKNPDFEDLEDMNLPPEILKSVKQARIQARQIISQIEPRHITSWMDLLVKLEIAVKGARVTERLYNPTATERIL